jgi:hypothetical protein
MEALFHLEAEHTAIPLDGFVEAGDAHAAVVKREMNLSH